MDLLSRREFTKFLLGLGFSQKLLAESPLPIIANSTDTLPYTYRKFSSQYGISDSSFSFEEKTLTLKNGILRLNETHFCLVDFKMNSTQKRFSIVAKNSQPALSCFASHGVNSGNTTAFAFSNTLNSFQSSLGIFVTGAHYVGQFGPSIILHGVSPSNDQALKRNVVIHGAHYCSSRHIEKYGFLGRSLGCIALPKSDMLTAYQTLKPGTLVFAQGVVPNKTSETLAAPTPEEQIENRIAL